MNKIISLYRDAVRDDWDKQTDATLANMQEAEQNIFTAFAAGEEAVKKVAELEKDSERKADLFVKKCFECDEFERQASAGQRAVDAMEQNILSIVDACFHAFASSFRNDAKEMAEDLIKTIIQQSKEAR
jgi:hypothetical protein